MNDMTQPAAGAESGGEAPGSDSSGDEPNSSGQGKTAGPPIFQRLTALFRHRNGSDLREDLADALAQTASGTSFSPGERAMLRNILRLREVRVEDVMVPRADVEAIDLSTSLGALLALFEQSGHSRMPVFCETLDDPRGMVHIRDVVAHITRVARHKKGRGQRKPGPPASLDLSNIDLDSTIGELNLIRTVLFVPPSMLASDLMTRMQASRTQMALVIDEYGGTDGLVSLEDIVEMVVGDIEDEHDEDEPMIEQTGDGIFVVDAKAEIDEVAARIGEEFKVGEHAEDVDTIGGVIFNALGRVPTRGEVVQAIPGFEFHVLDADPRRIKRVRIVETRTTERRRRAVREVQG
jgi:CBS domain containing-hemolysin-like protein